MVASFDMLAWMPGAPEMLVIAAVALLFFGRRLPDVARSMGKSIVEFKKGLKDVKDDIDTAATLDDDRKALPADDQANENKSSTGGGVHSAEGCSSPAQHVRKMPTTTPWISTALGSTTIGSKSGFAGWSLILPFSR